MKLPYVVFGLGLFFALLSLTFGFVSSPRYTPIFVVAGISAVISAVCLVYVFRVGGGWRVAALLPGLIVVYVLTDISLRVGFGVRVFDFWR